MRPLVSGKSANETRNSIIQSGNDKCLTDYNAILNTCDDMRNSFAAGDIFASKSVPFLKSQNPRHESQAWLIGPTLKYNTTENKIIFVQHVPKKKRSVQDQTKFENKKITDAFDMLTAVKTSWDSPKIFYDVACTYEDINMYDKAVKFYQKAVKMVPADMFVDKERLPDTSKHRRKLERLTGTLLEKYIAERARLRSEMLDYENLMRRVRKLISHCMLFKLFVFALPDYDSAHLHLREAFTTASGDYEHVILLNFFHAYLTCFCLTGPQEILISHQILHGNGGSLAEAHIHILDDLLRRNPTSPIYLEWLGKRFAERSEFEVSRSYYKKARDLKAEPLPIDVALTMWTMVGKPREVQSDVCAGSAKRHYGGGPAVVINDTAQNEVDAALISAINKEPLIQINKDTDVDAAAALNRESYTTYGTPHQAATTVLYDIPVQGWQASTQAQLRRLELLKHDYHMPPLSEAQAETEKRRLYISRLPPTRPARRKSRPDVKAAGLPQIEAK